MQAAAGLGSSLLEPWKFVQLQPTCISACAHRPAGACASAALQRDDSADLIRVLIRPFTDVQQPGDCGPRGGGRAIFHAFALRPRKSGKKKMMDSKGCALALGFWGGVKPSEIRLITASARQYVMLQLNAALES